MKRICDSCGNTKWRWGDNSNGKPTLYCTSCGEQTNNDLFSVEEVGQKFGIARSTVIKMCLTRRIESTPVEKQYRFSSQQLQDYIERNTIKAGE